MTPVWKGTSMARRMVIGLAALTVATAATADSNIATPRKFAWAENVGWLNWRDADASTKGVEVFIGSHLRGYIWGENIGWINVGNGAAPYANTTDTNFGVNIAPGTGLMTGYAWAENIGWINFGPHAGNATWDAAAHRAFGYVWSENAGWINLDDAVALLCWIPGDANGDGAVNAADFTILAGGFGSTGNPRFRNGDANGDGTVNAADFTLLAGNFGSVCP